MCPAVYELCQSKLSTLPLSSINSLHTSIKHRKENATSHTSSQKNVTHECWLLRILAYLHTRAITHIYYTSHRSPDFFMGPRLVYGIISTCNVCYRKYSSFFTTHKLYDQRTIHFGTVVKSSLCIVTAADT